MPNNFCFPEQVTEGSLPNDTQVQLGVLLDEQWVKLFSLWHILGIIIGQDHFLFQSTYQVAETNWRKSDLYKTFGKKFVTKTKLVFQVFDVVLAADEALFKHGNIQVSNWHGKVLWNSIVTWKSIRKQYCDLEKYCTGGMDDWNASFRRLWKGYSWKENFAHFFDLNCQT